MQKGASHVSAPRPSELSVRLNRPLGAFKHIHGINLGPLMMSGAVRTSEHFSEIGFPTVRLHDCPYACWGTVDIPCIFPLFHLDHRDPKNYKFGRTDAYVQSILDCGSQIVYRLGTSIQHHPGLQEDTRPPEDYAKWAEICCNVIRHYNQGWADGFQHDIRYWEIWNEAEIGNNKQWAGTYEEFTTFFIRSATHFKAEFPDLMIGGPAFAGVNEKKVETFLAKLRDESCPLDFCSWHTYAQSPGELGEKSRMIRELLDRYDFRETESHLNEWNVGPRGRDWGKMRSDPKVARRFFDYVHSAGGAAFTASTLAELQDAPLEMTNYYSAGNLRWSIFDDSALPHKPFYTFRAFKALLEETPTRLEVSGSDADEGLAVLAGVSEDGRVLSLLLSNFASDTSKWKVRLEGLDASTTEVRSLVLDAERDLEQDSPESVRLEGAELSTDVPEETVRLVRVRMSNA
jgi:hypothetical protein